MSAHAAVSPCSHQSPAGDVKIVRPFPTATLYISMAGLQLYAAILLVTLHLLVAKFELEMHAYGPITNLDLHLKYLMMVMASILLLTAIALAP